jgi:hypothetical protein
MQRTPPSFRHIEANTLGSVPSARSRQTEAGRGRLGCHSPPTQTLSRTLYALQLLPSVYDCLK